MGERHAIRLAATTVAALLLTSGLGSGCVRGMFADYAIPFRITGTVIDATDGNALSDVALTFESETIPYPRDAHVGSSVDGTINMEYLLAFGRKERVPWLGEPRGPQDDFQFVLSRDGYAPAVRRFSLKGFDCSGPYSIDLGEIVLGPR